MMIKDIASAQEAMPDWETYQKGLEALALALGSAKGSEEGTKKALTINDLLVKVPLYGTVLVPHHGLTLLVAYPKNLQISSPLLRTPQVHSDIRLPIFPHGNRQHSDKTPRGNHRNQPGIK